MLVIRFWTYTKKKKLAIHLNELRATRTQLYVICIDTVICRWHIPLLLLLRSHQCYREKRINYAKGFFRGKKRWKASMKGTIFVHYDFTRELLKSFQLLEQFRITGNYEWATIPWDITDIRNLFYKENFSAIWNFFWMCSSL